MARGDNMSLPIRFGVGLFGMQSTRLRPAPFARLYRELVEDAVFAEELGFDSIWTTEHHFWYDGYCPAPVTSLAPLIRHTRHMQLATGMVLLPLHDPMRIAETAATVDALSDGRMVLGVALGYRDVEFDGLGLHRPHRARRMDEQIEVLMNAFSEPEVTFSGHRFCYERAGTVPRPRRTIPIWVGATSAAATARAARLGLPVMFGSTLGPEAIEKLREHYRQVAEEHGRDRDPGFSQSLTMWVGETQKEAERILPRMRYLLREQLGGWRYLKDSHGRLVGFDRPAELDEAVEKALRVCAVGTPDHVSQRIEQLVGVGLTHVVARIKFDDIDRDAFLECMQLVSKEVMPRFA